MRKKFALAIIIAFLSIALIGCSKGGTKELSTKEKVQDFEYMYQVIKEGYPYIDVNKRLNNVDWLANKDSYLKRIKSTRNDKKFIKELSLILADLHNGHTHLVNNKESYSMIKDGYGKLGWYDFFDDDKVKNRYEKFESQNKSKDVSKKMFSSRDLILKDVVKDKVGYMYLPQMTPRNKSVEEDMKIISDYIKTLENHKALIIDIRGNGGGNDLYWESIVSLIANEDMERRGFSLFRNSNKIINDYVNARGIYLTPMSELSEEVINNASKEILDKFSGFVKSQKIIKSNNSKFKGKIYLLVDKSVYSSSESFSIFCKDTNFATIIGTTTGGDGGGSDPVLFALPNSGLIVRMSSNMFLTRNGKCDEEFKTTPDFPVVNCKRTKDFKGDKCIKKVLELEGIGINEQ